MVSTIFAFIMFAALFVAPLTMVLLQNNSKIVLLEIEDSHDAEEGEDVKLKDFEETFFHDIWKQHKIASYNYNREAARLRVFEDFIFTHHPGVETPPPKYS